MKKYRGLIIIALILVCTSIIAYIAHYLIFHDPHHLFIFLVGDLAFVPLEVLLVGIIIDRILTRREQEEKISKLSMVVGAYYSEIGRDLAAMLLDSNAERQKLIDHMHVTDKWGKAEYKRAHEFASKQITSSFDKVDLVKLRTLLANKRAFMLVLIENPNLLEHQRFTDLLLASFHLLEELESRPSLINLPERDLAHINNDIRRAFQNLCIEWLDYMQHLQANYPFLYSHYLRIHPFQSSPSAIVE